MLLDFRDVVEIRGYLLPNLLIILLLPLQLYVLLSMNRTSDSPRNGRFIHVITSRYSLLGRLLSVSKRTVPSTL